MKHIACMSLAVVALLTTGCRKELDLDSGEWFDVEEFLDSKNARVDCGQTAPFEGENLRLHGLVGHGPDLYAQPKFFLVDACKGDVVIAVVVDSTLVAPLDSLLKANVDKPVKVEGIVVGFDRPQNFNCRRGFELHIDSEDDVRVE